MKNILVPAFDYNGIVCCVAITLSFGTFIVNGEWSIVKTPQRYSFFIHLS